MIDDKIILAIIGIIGGLITFLQKVLYGQGKSNYEIIVKLIDRFNKSDDRFKIMESRIIESAERRHEKLIDELNDMTDDINFLKGRINSK
tara:strand:- start:329 stop:598 length:270 start_codon:yes stop_codon:yes gene_type:complete